MNLLKIQNDLRSAPDDALANYVANPQPHVPSYLALSELQRRQKMREAYQGQQGEQPSVAEEIVSKEQQGGLAAMMGGMPQQAPQQAPQMPQPQMMAQAPIPQEAPVMMAEGGLASLPVDDDLYPESFAGGGIVAFDEGGDVSSQDIAYGQALDQSFLGVVPRAGGAFVSDVLGLPGQFFWERDPVTGKIYRRYEREGFMPRSSKFEENEAARREKGSKKYEQVKAAETARASAKLPSVSTANAQIADAALNAPSAYDMVNRTAPSIGVAPSATAPAQTPKTLTTESIRMSGQKSGPATTGRASYDDIAYVPPADRSAEFDTLARDPRSAQAAMDQFRGLVGEDAGLAAVKERMTRMDERAAKEEERAPWMALAKAGFKAASGRSPFALQNIGEGGIEGISDYAASRDRLDKAAERRFEMQARVAQAERAEQVAAAKYGLESEQADRAHNEKVKADKLNYQASRDLDVAGKQFDAKVKKATLQQGERQLDITEQHYKDSFNLGMHKAEKELQGIERYNIAQQTQIVNNNLTQATNDLKTLQTSGGTKAEIAAAQGVVDYYRRVANDLLAKSGFTPPPLPPAGAPGSGSLVKDKSGNFVYQPRK